MIAAGIAEQSRGLGRPVAVTRTIARTTLAAAAALVAFAPACAPLPPAAAGTEVVVHNPSGAPVWLHASDRGGWRQPQTLGSATTHRLQLPVGRYALSHTPTRARVGVWLSA